MVAIMQHDSHSIRIGTLIIAFSVSKSICLAQY